MNSLPTVSSSQPLTPDSSRASSSSSDTARAAAAIRMILDPSERGIWVGKTGSGKSYHARACLQIVARKGWRVVLVDIQGMWMGKRPQWAKDGPGTVEKPRLVTRFNPKLRVQIYIPTQPASEDPGLLQLYADVLKAGDTVIYFDELYGIVTASRVPALFLQLWAQGRKLNVGAWAATQRPRGIPEIVLSQAEAYYVFRITNPEDRKRVADYMGSPEVKRGAIPSRWWWYLHQETMESAQLMRPIGKGLAA